MARYKNVAGIAREISKRYINVDGIAREISKGYKNIGGIAMEYFSSEKTAGDYEIGDSVFLLVDSKPTEFIVVHQGNPDSNFYAENCNGTWLLLKYMAMWSDKEYAESPYGVWDSTDNDYMNSDVVTLLNDSYYYKFSSNAQDAIKEVNIPYYHGNGQSADGHVRTGLNGLETKIFLLSCGECNMPDPNYPVDGVCLDYFANTPEGDDKFIYARVSDPTNKWLWPHRTPFNAPGAAVAKDMVSCVRNTGMSGGTDCTNDFHFRYALILDSSASFDPKTNVLL